MTSKVRFLGASLSATMMLGCGGSSDNSPDAGASTGRIVYVENNNIAANQNGVMAFAQAADGSLSQIGGSPFLTGGTGIGNPTQALGPDDTDQELILNAAGTKLYAVNAGSNTIAVFDVAGTGALTPIRGSPFASGGISPVSLGIAGNFLYVVNSAQDPAQVAANGTPNYVSLPIAANGALGAVAATQPAGKAPQIALTTSNGKLLFGVDFMAPTQTPSVGPIRAFSLSATGAMTAAPGTPLAIPAVATDSKPPLALGAWVHPTQSILYVGYVLRNQIGTYTFDPTTGTPSYVTSTQLTGAAVCWIRSNATGTVLYATTTGDDGVSVIDNSNPMAPVEKQHLVLKDSGPLFDAGTMEAPTSESYEENLSADGKFLFVLSERLTIDGTVSTGNVLHTLSVAADGTLSETVPDVPLEVAIGVRPQGVAVLR